MGPEESKPHTPGGKTALSQETPQSAPDPAMGPGPVWLVVVCLLGAGPTDTGGAGSRVTQAPRYLVVQNGENVTLNCEQNMNHDYMFWYRQDPGLGLRLIHLSRNTDFTEPGLVDAGVTQTPRHLLVRTGTEVNLSCEQNQNHNAMYWYQQNPGLGLQLIYYSSNIGLTHKGDIPQGYSVTRKEKAHFPLTLASADTSQSSLYFCASSVTTASAAHKPPYTQTSPGPEQKAGRGNEGLIYP
ncbi:uncharacterized protein LOC114809202 [Ornithorhynchus anatinus]|uniref:uncharacterized protein LOC114809202 n=1 Tax=Ornithorhynchus anatinus TaxID=9258 RepID=UPI0019D42970|nr:uncharacterized protein LOC114809202 [Ornithorhynchus anatinus]